MKILSTRKIRKNLASDEDRIGDVNHIIVILDITTFVILSLLNAMCLLLANMFPIFNYRRRTVCTVL